MKTLEFIFTLISGSLQGIYNFLLLLFPEQKKTIYDADFSAPGEIISTWNYGFCLDGKRSLTIHDSFKNVLVLGATGNFKSSGILIPSILKMRGRSSLVINDPSGELYAKTSGALAREGYKIMLLNYSNPTVSEGYNPLLRIRSSSDIQKLSKMIVRNALGTAPKDPFWNMASENLISLCIQYILEHTSQEYHTLSNVHYLISTLGYAPERVDKLFIRAHERLLTEYKSFVAYGDKTLASIVATCRAALSLFATDGSVALVTSHDTIQFADFRKEKIALFINTSVIDMRYYSLITSLFLEQFFAEVMSHLPNKNKRELPVFFLIDEASSLYFNSLQITLSNCRKYASGILQIYQSASQLVDLYTAPVARAITENSFARVHMAGQPITVAQELEATLGKFEYVDEKGARQIRSLMTAPEIRESKESLILCGNNRVIKTRTVPYFEQIRFSWLTSLQPLQNMRGVPFSEPSLIPIPD